MTQHGSQEIRF